jgi:prepilin-type N-terminal cleavage/methylation domain-containing protein
MLIKLKNNVIKRKRLLFNKKGFTLIELLLVMAIIGILAGIIMIGMSSSRKRAKVTSALKIANGVTAELADCYLNNKPVTSPSAGGGGRICVGAGNYPALSDLNCSYGTYVNNVLTIDCSASNNATITCNVTEGNCKAIYH